jgi:serine/threonine protein kinase
MSSLVQSSPIWFTRPNTSPNNDPVNPDHTPAAGEVVAAKAQSKLSVGEVEGGLDRVTIERNILLKLTKTPHPFIVSLLATFQSKDFYFIMVEYAPNGNLMEYLTKNSNGSDGPSGIKSHQLVRLSRL